MTGSTRGAAYLAQLRLMLGKLINVRDEVAGSDPDKALQLADAAADLQRVIEPLESRSRARRDAAREREIQKPASGAGTLATQPRRPRRKQSGVWKPDRAADRKTDR
jgi:hypothetical protein